MWWDLKLLVPKLSVEMWLDHLWLVMLLLVHLLLVLMSLAEMLGPLLALLRVEM